MLLSVLTLIIDTIAGLMAAVLLLRFWMQAVRIRPPAQVGQFTFQLTDWLVRPLRRLLPGFGGYDWASLLAAILVALLATGLKTTLLPIFAMQLYLLLSVTLLLQWILYGFMGLLLLEVLFSWVNPQAPLAPFVQALNAPLLRPFRKIIPLVGNLDLTVLLVFVLLQIALQLVGHLPGLAV
ncbi:MAG: YggT family protein [Pseudomonadota bacterium]